ncbi:hypothetical protein DRN94_003555 [archaeon]|nr:hypothetical protein [archaeon]
MALLGLVKFPGEATVATVREWLGTDYVKATAVASATTFIEELTNRLVSTTLNLTGYRELIYREIHRAFFSALYFFGFKSFRAPLTGLVASVIPITLIGVDLITLAIGASSEQLGVELGVRLREWATVAAASAGIGRLFAPTPTPRPAAAPSKPTLKII